jgi:hypothetical protein
MILTNDLLRNAADLRDAVIFVASIIYIIGYITWASYSYYRRLGTVKALDAQYFVIGIPVALLMVLVLSAMSNLGIWLDSWNLYLYSLGSQFRFIIGIIFLVLGVIVILFYLRTRHKNFRLSFILAILFWIIVVLTPDSGGLLRLTSRIMLTVVTLAIFAILIVIYVTRVYELIPHTLGGGKCRTARFDLIKRAISPTLLKQLAANRVGNHSIIQSRDVTVVSISDNWVLVRVGQVQDTSAPIIELPRTSIASVIWLAS